MNKRFLLSESNPSQRIRVLAGKVTLPVSEKRTSWVTITRTGSFTDHRYGRFDITHEMLLSMVKSHENHILGIDIFLDVSHKPDEGAAAKIIKLAVDGSRLRALVEWTDFGIDAVKKRGFQYLSADFTENFQDNEAGAFHGPVLFGAGLTVRPVIKHLDPVTLSCASDEPLSGRFFIHPELVKKLLSEDTFIMNKYLKALLERLANKKLAQSAIDNIKQLAEDNLAVITEESAQEAFCAGLEKTVLQLAETVPTTQPGTQKQEPNVTIKPSISLAADAAAPVLNLADVDKRIDKFLADQQTANIKLAETKAANIKLLSDTINAAKGLDDELKKTLSESLSGIITSEMTADQIKSLAQVQIEHGNQLIASRSLANMGYSPNGSPRITLPDEGVKKLSGIYRDYLSLSSSASSLHLDPKEPLHPFCERVLAEFDRINAPKLHEEAKTLADGTTSTSSTHLPYGFQREVIREALSDLNVLQLVQALTDFNAQATTQIPYETRDTSQIMNDGLVFESQEIPYAGITQAMDTAYVSQMKIALKVTNEVIHFTRASAINWDAFARNIESNARVLKELVVRRICNELQRASDSYLALKVENESFTAALGATHTIKTKDFPLVAPHQDRDLKGNAVNLPENPITITLNSVVILPFNGTGEQPAGTYYRVLSFNLGVIQFVDQLGVPTVPDATGTNTISYSRATNVKKFNLDVGAGGDLEKHLNGLIAAVGSRKAMMASQRYVTPDFLLMSATLNDTASNASQFINLLKRDGSNTNSAGDLEAIKSIPAYGTNAPGIHLGDERILMGQKNLGSYVIAKPFATSEPIDVMKNGHPTGEKVCYGEEYNAIKVPQPVRNRFTSVVAYSESARNNI